MADTQGTRTSSRATEETKMEESGAVATENKPSKLKQLWKKIDLDKGTAIMMLKVRVPIDIE